MQSGSPRPSQAEPPQSRANRPDPRWSHAILTATVLVALARHLNDPDATRATTPRARRPKRLMLLVGALLVVMAASRLPTARSAPTTPVPPRTPDHVTSLHDQPMTDEDEPYDDGDLGPDTPPPNATIGVADNGVHLEPELPPGAPLLPHIPDGADDETPPYLAPTPPWVFEAGGLVDAILGAYLSLIHI